jgi:alkylated DNA nucleotide flippase Atl1
MAYQRKTWGEKLLDKPGYPKVLSLEEGFPCYKAVHKMGANAGDMVVLVNPSEVVEIMRRVPEGRVTTITEICKAIARMHGVPACCTLTTGIFIMTVANACAEAEDELGNMPYWRTLKTDGFLNEKYPGGQEGHRNRLEAEGLCVITRGKRYQVEGLNHCLYYP